jgi:spore germination cell wall hydrolase CwlJ-like protein
MRNNKAILDEAARSVRRTFISSVAGSAAMLAVVGAAGAYGMPERLTAQALSAAMAKFNVKFAHDRTATPTERPVVLAQNIEQSAPMPVSTVTDVAEPSPVVRMLPQVAAPVVTEVAVAPSAPALPQVASIVAEPVQIIAAPAPQPVEPQVTASLAPRDLPKPADALPFISAPMVFEAPKAADAQVLTALSKTELVVPTPEPMSKPAAMQALASAAAMPDPVEFPKSVMLRLPMPKPPMSPAQRLELQGKDYDKAEKCLAQAVYFEARNEPARGQQAVAQVVLNRVFSPYYPKDVCSVVYQNAHRHLSCQFTFACDGKPEAVNEMGAWARANRIAKQTLDAKVWLPDVNKATHYHASYVRPNWIRDMNVMVRYGLHTFYRPRNWGDGSDEAHWGTAANALKSAPTAAKPLTPAQRKFAYRKT